MAATTASIGLTTRGLAGGCLVVLAAAAACGSSEGGDRAAFQAFQQPPWPQVAAELREDMSFAIDQTDEPLPSTEAEIHARLAGLLDSRPFDPWNNPLLVEVMLVTQTAERLVFGDPGDSPTLAEVEQDHLLVELVSGGPDGVYGTEDDHRVTDLRVPLPRPREADPVLFVRPQHGAIVGVALEQASGQPLPGVVITVVGPSVGGSRTVVSDEHGSFVVRLPAGAYEVRFERDGYQLETVQHVVVRSQSVRRLEVELLHVRFDCG